MITINVCIGSACHIKGSYDVIISLQKLIEQNKLSDKITVKPSFCLGECSKAVSIKVDERDIESVNPETVEDFFKRIVEDI